MQGAETLLEAVQALYSFIENELEVPGDKRQALIALQLQVNQMMEKKPRGGRVTRTIRKRMQPSVSAVDSEDE